jgi:hypothetical protein
VIVLASGLNDLMHGRSPDETTGILRQFIANARAARPNVGGTVQHSYTYNLTPGATYDFKIQGVRRVMKSTLGTATTIKAPPLGRVRAVRVYPRRVTWPAVPGATQYRVHCRVPGKTAWHKYVRGTTLKVPTSIAQVSARNAFTSSAVTTGRRH